MALSNPSHILIARSSRAPHATLSTPEAHAGSTAGVPRNSASPPTMTILASDESEDEELTGPIDYHEPNEFAQEAVDPTFREDYEFPGTVKITVQDTIFWTHKEMLYFASPFFKAALGGGWLETTRPASVASIITIHQPPTVLRDISNTETGSEKTEIQHVSTELAALGLGSDIEDTDIFTLSEDDEEESEDDRVKKEKERHASFEKLEGGSGRAATLSPQRLSQSQSRSPGVNSSRNRRRRMRVPEAYIELKEEKASTFHDFLKFVYPHLECIITWNNVEGLTNISHKLVVPNLQEACINFLFSHAAGKPIKALRIAEIFDEEELYREASRFVLDNPGGWPDAELRTLSQETLLKLEKRRTWFLERVLKLNLVPIVKEYTCCATCPDPSNCARLLDEKWKSGVAALSRFGPIQPSMVFRYLRSLEGGSPPFTLTHHACQQTAKTWVGSLFDRMFSLGLRGSPDSAPTDPRVPHQGHGPRRHFLYCQLRESKTPTSRKSRLIS